MNQQSEKKVPVKVPVRNVAPARMLDRMPPNSPEAESGVLGCMILDPEIAGNSAVEKIGLDGEAFYDLRHQEIYKVLARIITDGNSLSQGVFDIGRLIIELRKNQMLERVGGIAKLIDLQNNSTPSAANLPYYLGVLMDKARLRKLMQVCVNGTHKVHEHEGEVDDCISDVERDILAIRTGAATGWTNLASALANLTDKYDRQCRGEYTGGINTGLLDLDKELGFFEPQNVVVIGARPSVGKTSMALNIVQHAVFNLGIPSAVFSLEMSSEELLHRTVCTMAEIDNLAIKEQRATVGDIQKMTVQMAKVRKAPLHICDSGGLTIGKIIGMARAIVRLHGVKLLVIDYLQLIRPGKSKSKGLREDITLISNAIKQLAKELHIVIILVSQLNRDSENEGRAPSARDLRESGAIEQDADVIVLLHQDPKERGKVIAGVEKNRNGRSGGKVSLTWIPQYTKFQNFSPVSANDVPEAGNQEYAD